MPRIRPVGQPTRGKTALNRLRQVDNFVALAYAETLSTGVPLVVDVGFGAQAWTTLEIRERWLPINPRLRVLGIEIDPKRVAIALPYADLPQIDFRLGGFNVRDVIGSEQARLIRAYNVLRQYEESAVADALATMADALEPGGLLVEGTSTPTGRIVAFDIYRQTDQGLRHLALVFGTNFSQPLDPVDFQAILPKRLIHHMRDEIPLGFFNAWRDSFTLARGIGHTGRRQGWYSAAMILRERFGYPVDSRARILQRGFLPLYATLSP